MSPAEPQVVVTEPTAAAIFLVLTAASGAEAEIRDVLGDVGAIRRSVGFRVPEGQLTCVVGIGSLLWDRLFSGPRPAELHPLPQSEDRFTPLRARPVISCSTFGPSAPISASSSPRDSPSASGARRA